MTQTSDSILDQIKDISQLEAIIRASKCDLAATKCDKINSILKHVNCLAANGGDESDSSSSVSGPVICNGDRQNQTSPTPRARCPKSLIYLIVLVIAKKPNLIDDNIKVQVSNYFKLNGAKATGLVSRDVLQLLHAECESKLITWIKFEALLVQLIRDYVYEPKIMASEILETVKDDLEPRLAANFSSILSGCVKVCREVNNRMALNDEEEQEKWCEIIDWMSWFLAGAEADDYDTS